MSKLKLLQINVTANWGSTGKIAEGIGLAAMIHGWESTIAFGRSFNPSKSRLIKVGSKKDVYLHYVRHRFLDGEGLGSKRATKKLISEIKTFAPDIIQLHNIHDHWLNYPLLFEYFATIDTPIVWTFHDCWAFTGGCPHFENDGCFKWKVGCHDCKLIQRFQIDHSARNFRLKKELLQKLGNRLTVVCVSEWITGYVRQSFLRNCRIEVINNGINLNMFKPSDSLTKRKRILGVSNVWTQFKGLDDFIKLREKLPAEIEIVLVGLTAKQITGMPSGITGLGRTKSVDELVKLYQSTTAFVNPTYNDSFPTVNLEALACGTPVITYRTGGSSEAVDEKTGIVIDKGDLAGLADAIMRVIYTPEIYTPENCRQRAVNNFNQEIQFNKYIDLYEELLNNTNNNVHF